MSEKPKDARGILNQSGADALRTAVMNVEAVTTSKRKPLSAYRVDHSDTIGMTWEQIDALRPPFVVDGFGRQGELMLVAAESKSRKSWLVQDMGFCAGMGEPWLANEDGTGGFATAKCKVHVIDLELNDGEMRFRFAKARGNRTASPSEQKAITGQFAHYSMEDCMTDDVFEYLEELKPTVTRGDLIIVDCLYRLHPDGNETEAIARAFTLLKRLAKDTGALVVIVDHFRKAGADKARDRIAGSFVKSASASTIVAIETNAEAVLSMSIDARTFHGNAKVSARFDLDTYRFVSVGADYATAETTSDCEKWLVELWKSHDHGQPVTTAGAAAKWQGKISRQGAENRLKQLEKMLWVVSKSQGTGKATLWSLTAKGQDVIRGATEAVAPVAGLLPDF